jgi:hypothetical protein
MTKYNPAMEKQCADAIKFLKKNPGVKWLIIIANFFIRDRILKN